MQTTHFKLINAIAKEAQSLNLSKEHDHSAHRFHTDLFLSGIERILLVRSQIQCIYHLADNAYRSLAKHPRLITQIFISSWLVTLHLQHKRNTKFHGLSLASWGLRLLEWANLDGKHQQPHHLPPVDKTTQQCSQCRRNWTRSSLSKYANHIFRSCILILRHTFWKPNYVHMLIKSPYVVCMLHIRGVPNPCCYINA